MDILRNPNVTEKEVVDGLAGAVGQLLAAAKFGQQVAPHITRIRLVAEGAGLFIAEAFRWMHAEHSAGITFEADSATDYKDQGYPGCDNDRMLVVVYSKSGDTGSVSDVAKALRDKPCRVVIFSDAAKEISGFGEKSFDTGKYGYYAGYMLMQAMFGGVWEKRESWTGLPPLLRSLSNLAKALFEAASSADSIARAAAGRYIDGKMLYLIASGLTKTTSGAVVKCVVTENFKILSDALDASQFFHYDCEMFRPGQDYNVILCIGEDGSRKQMEEKLAFFEKHHIAVSVFDSSSVRMEGIDKDIRAMVAPFVVGAMLERYVHYLQLKTGIPIDKSNLLHMGRNPKFPIV